MTSTSRSSRRRSRRRPRAAPVDHRLRVALLAGAAVVVVALAATTVVVLNGQDRPGRASTTGSTGCAAMTQPVRYQVNPKARTGLLSTSAGAAAAAADAGYSRDEGVLFRAATGPATGLVAVHQVRRGAGDQLWTTDATELREATQWSGYVDLGVAAYVSAVPAPCTVEVERFQSGGLHRYAATTAQRDALRDDGWTPEGSFFGARPDAGPSPTATPGSTALPVPRPAPKPSSTGPAGSRVVIDAPFDDVPTGPVTPDAFIRALGAASHDPGAYDSMSFVRQGGGSTSRFARTHLAAGKILGRNGAHGDGNVLVVPLEDQSEDSACLAYDVRFSSSFEVSAGGKLPGLLGVAPGVPPGTPTGGGSTALGWSGRVMWLGPKLSKTVRDSGQPDLAVTYLYHPGQAGTFGDDISWGRGFVDGRWHQVRQCYTLNTVGRSDGRLRAWVDGDQVLDRSDVVYRTSKEVHITHLDWSVFRGGDSADWAAGSGGDVDLDNLVVTVG